MRSLDVIDARNQVFVNAADAIIEPSRSQRLPRFFALSLARFRIAHFANGRSPLSGTKQRGKLRKERQKKKENEARSGSELDEGDYMRGYENERQSERREERGRERERARASCRHLGLAFNLRASRRALIRAGSSSRYEPGLRYKQELEWVRRSGGSGRRGYV